MTYRGFFVTVLLTLIGRIFADQVLVDYISEKLLMQYTVIDSGSSYNLRSAIIFTNSGPDNINDKSWEIHFNHIRMIEPDLIRPQGTALGQSGLMVHHVNGVHFKITPGPDFDGFDSGEVVTAEFTAEAWQVSRTDIMPNWFVTAPNAQPKTLLSTSGEDLGFVTDFTSAVQWKRHPDDLYNPFTPEERLSIQGVFDAGHATIPIIPTPVYVDLSDVEKVDLGSDSDSWVVVYGNEEVLREAQMLADKMGLSVVQASGKPSHHFIQLELGDVFHDNNPIETDEAYSLVIDTNSTSITIIGRDSAGVFYGTQSLLSLADGSTNSQIPAGTIVDYPRFHYRGQHIDVSRNFHSKESILKHLETMAMYKLNKFHFHLTDDEGWRLEIPGLPELTTVGSNRCFDPSGDLCLMPQLGSGHSIESSGSGFYTTSDYKEIIQFASDRHIQVLPEFDMPGHAHSSINAMLARYRALKDSNITAAEEFLLSDRDDESDYLSVQYFTDNAVNPCLESTYKFIEHIVTETIKLHEGIQPLTVFNFGGDEVPHGSWEKSPACLQIYGENIDSVIIKRDFAFRVAEIAHSYGLDLSAWEDGLMNGFEAFNRSRLPNMNVTAYMWDNVWEWGRGQRSYIMANNDYQVVLSHATHLYFDHPYEPDPEERGYYWATRIAPTRKTFSFAPDNIYENMLVDGNGRDLNRQEICNQYGCELLLPNKGANIIGMQGHLWSETVRTSDQLDYMVYPRAIALAERAWNKAQWEHMPEGEEREEVLLQDWSDFSNTLGHKELRRLDALSVAYQIPPPGAAIDEDGTLVTEADYPGLVVQYSLDDGSSWNDYSSRFNLEPGQRVLLHTLSASGARRSRQVELKRPEDGATSDCNLVCCSLLVALIATLTLVKTWL